jgi:DNA-binding CsgD family transcriptional regulator
MFWEGLEFAANPEAMERFLLRRLCELLHAKVVVHFRLRDVRHGGRGALLSSVDDGWIADEDRQRTLAFYQQHGIGGNLFSSALMTRFKPGLELTARREDVVPDGVWYRSTFYREVVRPGRGNHSIYSMRSAATGNEVSGLGLTREHGDRRFDDHEVIAVHMFHHHLIPQLRRCAPPPRATLPRLSPRERQTLDGLLDGLAEKQIAASLGLSRHTVHEYVKALYRRFDVTSRAELVARLGRRGGRLCD